MECAIFWFRRDLRLTDNVGLCHALESYLPVIPLFIFDTNITDELPKDDARISFIYQQLKKINKELQKQNSSIVIAKGKPLTVWEQLLKKYTVKKVYVNKDYEPYATARDLEIRKLLERNNIEFKTYKDMVVFEESEIVKNDGKPYSIYTPYKNKWLKAFAEIGLKSLNDIQINNWGVNNSPFPAIQDLGFELSKVKVKPYDLSILNTYEEERNIPAFDSTSYLGPHLRFGVIGIRELIAQLMPNHQVFLSELIWREFFMCILYHYPHVINNNFYKKYDTVNWRNNKSEFDLWCAGRTGYPLVDAGMRQLNKTGFMHNRVRMVTASFLCKHLLIDWRWGEAYFAQKLLDYELSSNNGNWQWAAGTGCDAAPYFRVFNPTTQLAKFDKNLEYVRKWVPEYGTRAYPKPIVEHTNARNRAIETYNAALKK